PDMVSSRMKEPSSPAKRRRRKDVPAPHTTDSPATGSLRPTPSQRLFARPAVWLMVASIAVFFCGTGGLLWSRPHFDMVKALADLAAHEGTWDNPWDLQDKKIASLEADIKAEASPIKRLILGRELAQQYVAEGVSGGAIAILEQLLSEYGPSIPAA